MARYAGTLIFPGNWKPGDWTPGPLPPRSWLTKPPEVTRTFDGADEITLELATFTRNVVGVEVVDSTNFADQPTFRSGEGRTLLQVVPHLASLLPAFFPYVSSALGGLRVTFLADRDEGAFRFRTIRAAGYLDGGPSEEKSVSGSIVEVSGIAKVPQKLQAPLVSVQGPWTWRRSVPTVSKTKLTLTDPETYTDDSGKFGFTVDGMAPPSATPPDAITFASWIPLVNFGSAGLYTSPIEARYDRGTGNFGWMLKDVTGQRVRGPWYSITAAWEYVYRYDPAQSTLLILA